MKETKKFFENNRLNKGYAKIPNAQKSDIAIIKERYKYVLPPIDVISEYEDLYPDTFNRLLKMAESEQNNRYALELLTVENYNKTVRLGRICFLIFIALICTATVILSLKGNLVSAIVFAVLSFLTAVTLVYFLYAKVQATKNIDNFVDNSFRNKNSNRRKYKNRNNHR